MSSSPSPNLYTLDICFDLIMVPASHLTYALWPDNDPDLMFPPNLYTLDIWFDLIMIHPPLGISHTLKLHECKAPGGTCSTI